MFEKGLLQDVHHNLWEILSGGGRRSRLRQPNSGKIYRKVGRTHCGNDFLNTLLDSSSPHQTFIPSDTWILSIHLHPPPPCTQHSHTIYTQRPSFSVPFILYKKLFYSTKLTDHHSSSPSAAQSQPTASKAQ